MPLAAVCPVHGPFPARSIKARNSTDISIGGGSEPCPQCGRQSRLTPGRFDFDAQGIATVLDGPEWTKAALARVQAAVERATKERTREAVEAAVEEVRDTSPDVAQKLGFNKPGLTLDQKIQLLQLLLSMISAVLGAVAVVKADDPTPRHHHERVEDHSPRHPSEQRPKPPSSPQPRNRSEPPPPEGQ